MMWYELYLLIGFIYALFIVVVNTKLRSKYPEYAMHNSALQRLVVALVTAIIYPLLILAITIAISEENLRRRAMLDDLKKLSELVKDRKDEV